MRIKFSFGGTNDQPKDFRLCVIEDLAQELRSDENTGGTMMGSRLAITYLRGSAVGSVGSDIWGHTPLFFSDQRALWMSGSETIASLRGVSRPSPTLSSCDTALADPKPQRFDVQFMFQMMQDFGTA